MSLISGEESNIEAVSPSVFVILLSAPCDSRILVTSSWQQNVAETIIETCHEIIMGESSKIKNILNFSYLNSKTKIRPRSAVGRESDCRP